MLEQRRYQLNRSASRIRKPRFVVFDLLNSLKLEVAFWIVIVRRTKVVDQRLDATRREHLHHHRSARPRQPRHDHYGVALHLIGNARVHLAAAATAGSRRPSTA